MGLLPRRSGADHVDRADDVMLHLGASCVLVPVVQRGADAFMVGVSVVEGGTKGLRDVGGVDEEVGMSHIRAGLGHDPGVSHVVDGVVEAPVERAVALGAIAGVGAGAQRPDRGEDPATGLMSVGSSAIFTVGTVALGVVAGSRSA